MVCLLSPHAYAIIALCIVVIINIYLPCAQKWKLRKRKRKRKLGCSAHDLLKVDLRHADLLGRVSNVSVTVRIILLL